MIMNLKTVVIAVLCFSYAVAGGHERKKWVEWKEKPDEECDEAESEELGSSSIGSVPGTPGEDYPSLTEIPNTGFICPDKDGVPGFYPDMETGCQHSSLEYEGKNYEDSEKPELDEVKNPQESSSDFPPIARSIHGIPGIDFPIFTDIPDTKFTCAEQDYVPGFYADLETGCQVFHLCHKDGHESYLCPVGTIFSQHLNACDYWNNVDCSKSPKQGPKTSSPGELEKTQSPDIITKEFLDSMLEKVLGQVSRSESQLKTSKYQKLISKTSDLVQKRIQCEGKGCEEPESEYFVQTSSDIPNFPLVTRPVKGIPGVDFPIFKDIPKTKFTCGDYGYVPGLYADLETGCQVFHLCSSANHHMSFLCPIGTTFNHVLNACDEWYKVPCSLPSRQKDNRILEESKEPGRSDLGGSQLHNTPRYWKQMTRYANNPGSDVCYENKVQCSLRPTTNFFIKSLEVGDNWYTDACSEFPYHGKADFCLPNEREEHDSFGPITTELLKAMLDEELPDKLSYSEIDYQLESKTSTNREQNPRSKAKPIGYSIPRHKLPQYEEETSFLKSEDVAEDQAFVSSPMYYKQPSEKSSDSQNIWISKSSETAAKRVSSILESLIPLLPVKCEVVYLPEKLNKT